MKVNSSYDSIAGMYDRFWRDWYVPAALPALQRLFFDQIAPPTKILDVCCGSGHVTAELVRRGFCVTGIDSSAELIDLARFNVPGAEFLVQDVRTLHLQGAFDAAISTFDALNHLLVIEDLRDAFRAVVGALKPNGLFVFDMNLEKAYTLDLRQWNATVEEDSVSLVRGTFDPISKLAETELIWFTRTSGDNWRRRSSVIEERCYTQSEILGALAEAGFSTIEAMPAVQAGVSADVGFGRIFVCGRRGK
ncbi:MAG TPA: class I SAM-dependent methyltransferase [Bryobacteraceae bacterium]|nr:class I SAM-dependent methyltransferase [Bryobacteraceae bacterium]